MHTDAPRKNNAKRKRKKRKEKKPQTDQCLRSVVLNRFKFSEPQTRQI